MPRAQLTITINDDGTVSITGPIHDKMVCYALLEVGRDTIKEHADALAKSPIVPVTPHLPANLRRG